MSQNAYKKQILFNIACGQSGYFTTSQAKSAGYTKGSFSHHIKSGNWIKIDHSIYRLPDFSDSLKSNCTRWCLWSRNQSGQPQGIISHSTALQLLGIDYPASNSNAIHMTVPKGFRKRLPDNTGCIIHKENLPLSELKNWGEFMSTNTYRTLKDLKEELEVCGIWSKIASHAANDGKLTSEQMQKLGIINLSAPHSGTTYNIELNNKNAVYYRAKDTEQIFEAMQRGQWSMSTNTYNSSKKLQRGFTLVELLVVIAIISVLAGMLLPALQNAQNAAMSILCKNRLRQTMLATSMYGDDNAGWGPYHYFYDSATSYESYWSMDLENNGYMPVKTDAFICPSYTPESRAELSGYPLKQRTYGMWLFRSARYMKLFPPKAVDTGSATVSTMREPSRQIVYADSKYKTQEQQISYFDHRGFNTGVIHMRHAGAANCVYLDMHTETNWTEDLVELGFTYWEAE
jgi:prepilin-type N-terminal cleavage/methylation domain-containing protein